MDKKTIAEFDKVLMNTVSKNTYMDRILSIIFEVLLVIVAVTIDGSLIERIPASAFAATVFFTFLSIYKICFDIVKYLYVRAGGVSTSVYYVLRLAPCDKKLFLRSRIIRLTKTHGLFVLITLVLKLVFQLTIGTFNLIGLIWVFAAIGILPYIYGLFLVFQSTSWKWTKQG